MTGSEAVVNGPVSGFRKLWQVGWHGCSRYRARISDNFGLSRIHEGKRSLDLCFPKQGGTVIPFRPCMSL